jgi:Tfp pilus assembly protein PilO
MLNEMQRSRIDELASQKPQTQQLEDELTKLEAAIPASIDSAGLLRDLEALQQSSGAMVTGVSLGTPLAAEVEAPAVAATTDGEEEGLTAPADLPETPAFSGGIFEVPLTLDISGSFEQVREFVRALQLNERLVFANAIEINGSGDLYTAVVDAVVFALPA